MSDFDEYDVEFDKLKDLERTDIARVASFNKLEDRSRKKKLRILPMIASSVVVSVVALFLVLTLFEYVPNLGSGKSIIDDQTELEIPIVEVTANMFTVEYGIDNMDRGNHDYETTGTDKRIVIDLGVSNFKRGDIVYFKMPVYSNENSGLNLKEHQLSRIVGLPGEKIEIKKGQVFINNQKLEAFYSIPTVRGMAMEEYFEKVSSQNTMMNEEDFQENMESILVPEGSVFVLGDQWWRSVDSRHFGPISLSDVEGKVLGYDR
ncbi:signal peptidase I [Sporosarcina beigongshangi]|uniref:signal peptidase I n=1 Tax=Sporosarcina beigongshangi TaxID=2782538 RepID=UPI0019396CA5|nr:signal peptidase I [Sporosarcina beigongshangi]